LSARREGVRRYVEVICSTLSMLGEPEHRIDP
jgi:hypothetical protein